LYDGSIKLKDGLGQVQAGIGSLYGGVTQINGGLQDAKSGATQISDGLNAMNGKMPELEKGVSDLYKGSEDLKAGIDKASNGAIQVNQGIKDFSDKGLTPVASGIGQLDGALNDQVLPSMKKINDGAAQVSAGIDELISNMTASQTAMANVLAVYQQKVVEGTATADDVEKIITSIGTILNASNTPDNQQKVNALKTGAKTVSDGLKLVYSNLNGDFKTGLDGLNTNMPSVKAAADKLYKGSGELSNGLDALAGGAKAINNGLGQLNSKVPELSAGVVKLSNGSKNLVSGLEQLYSGSARLKEAISKPEQVKNLQSSSTSGGKNLFEGITALKDGALQLSNGLGEFNSKLPELQYGVNKLQDGSIQLSDGIVELTDGASKLSDKLQEGADKITKNLINDSDTMGEFVSEPLIMDEKPLNPVKDYGTGFAPYFIPLSLWVGALMMFFVITDKIDDDIEASNFSIVIGKFLSYGYIGILQAVLVSVVVMTLGLKPDNVLLYFLTNIFMSFVFIAIIQSLIFLMGQVGRLLSIVLLILQLTSCAGTFPLEVVPKLFKVLNPFMPFTYCVSALREVISGLDISIYGYDIGILAGFLVVFLVISVLMKGHADKIQFKIQEKKEAIV
ncbi:MAG: YhgE/Pip domain-containing protein, partial [Clostridiales bacterium]|nr:YhgE/Pip domain-containing protein [Clostridiales bacterium]